MTQYDRRCGHPPPPRSDIYCFTRRVKAADDNISYLRASVVISTQTIGQKQLQPRTAMPFGRIGPLDVMYIYRTTIL